MLNTVSRNPAVRKQLIRELLSVEGITGDEAATLAHNYWYPEICAHIADKDFEGSWRLITVAGLGEKALVGPDRICKAYVENQPVGLVCSPRSIMELVHVLFYEMRRSGVVGVDQMLSETPRWGKLFPSGNGIAQLLHLERNLHYYVASLQAFVIADWVNNHRRLSPTH